MHGNECQLLALTLLTSEHGCSPLQNGKLLAERDGVKRRSEELATEKDALKVQRLSKA